MLWRSFLMRIFCATIASPLHECSSFWLWTDCISLRSMNFRASPLPLARARLFQTLMFCTFQKTIQTNTSTLSSRVDALTDVTLLPNQKIQSILWLARACILSAYLEFPSKWTAILPEYLACIRSPPRVYFFWSSILSPFDCYCFN